MPASDITRDIDNYHSTFDPDQHYVELLYRDGKGSQGREQNDMQKIFNYRVQRLANAIFKDGDIIRGAQIAVDPETGHVTATTGTIFMDGFIWDVDAAEFDVPTQGTLAVGLHLVRSVVSELEDPGLLNPARGQRTEGLPGAWRLKIVARWGFEGDSQPGDFYAVYTLDDAVVRVKEAPPTLDSRPGSPAL